MVATDSYRLVGQGDAARVAARRRASRRTCPARALQELARIAQSADADDAPRRRCARTRSCSRSAAMVLSSRLIDGQFPNYRQLLPDTYEHELRLESRELTDVVRRISLLAQKNAPLRLRFAEGELTVSAQTPGRRRGVARPLPVPFAGEPFEIGFNPEFLRDGVESVDSDDLLLKLISPLRPGPDRGRRRERVPLPDHADPPERVSRAVVESPPRARLPHLREADVAARRGSHRHPRPERRGEDQPARGAVLRLHRPLVPDERTSARSSVSTRRRTRVEVARATATAPTSSRVGFQPGEPKRFKVDGAPVERLVDNPARPLVSVFLPDRLELVKGPPALRRAHLDQVVAALWPSRAATRTAYSRALAQRNALIGAHPPGPGVALVAARRGTRSSRATASRCATTAPRRSSGWPRRSPPRRRSSASPARRRCS